MKSLLAAIVVAATLATTVPSPALACARHNGCFGLGQISKLG
jgi:hypothetical protein